MSEYRERILKTLGDRPVVETLEATGARVEALAARLGAAGMRRSVAPGKWTAHQILAHLADAEIGVGFRLRQALAEDDHQAQAFDQDRWAARYGGLPADGVAAARAFCALRPWNVALIRTLTPKDLARPFYHPERGMESVDLIVKMLAGHDLNHIAQLEQIAAQ
jgi:hypothetical protein